jgi:hypothetical protein
MCVASVCVFAAQQLRRHGNNSAQSNLSLASRERTTRLVAAVCVCCCWLLLQTAETVAAEPYSNTNIVVGPILFVCLRIPCGHAKHCAQSIRRVESGSHHADEYSTIIALPETVLAHFSL